MSTNSETTLRQNERNVYVLVQSNENNAQINKNKQNNINYLTAKPITRARSLSPSVFTETVDSDSLKELQLDLVTSVARPASIAVTSKTNLVGNDTMNSSTN